MQASERRDLDREGRLRSRGEVPGLLETRLRRHAIGRQGVPHQDGQVPVSFLPFLRRKDHCRTPEPNSPQLVSTKVDTVSTISLAEQREKDKKENKERNENCVALEIPDHVPVTMAMTIFNVLSVKYQVN